MRSQAELLMSLDSRIGPPDSKSGMTDDRRLSKPLSARPRVSAALCILMGQQSWAEPTQWQHRTAGIPHSCQTASSKASGIGERRLSRIRQELLGHDGILTTQRHTHVTQKATGRIKSPVYNMQVGG